MSNDDILRTRAALSALARIGGPGLTAQALGAQVEAATGLLWGTADRDILLGQLAAQHYLFTHADPLTGQMLHSITETGRVALAGLGVL